MGNPENITEFENLYNYSPLHNIPELQSSIEAYPPILMLTGDSDERAPAYHSMKFTAELQHNLKNQNNPVLLKVYKDVGHGCSSTVRQKIEEETDKLAFLHKIYKN